MKVKMSYREYQWGPTGYMPMELTIKTMGIKQNFVLTDVTVNNEKTPDIVIPESIQAFIDEANQAEETEDLTE